MPVQQELPLSLPPVSGTVFINGRCRLRIEGDQRVIVPPSTPIRRPTGHFERGVGQEFWTPYGEVQSRLPQRGRTCRP